ncbi:response regulator [uncultured Cohaesibacter sp.]|uniref:response regulator n=1 Tax=uncultured Cohaesibacter sp. TaxID=1002546 RepID=UPI0029C99C9A|nr:response regulator [uncultured Cohaesibacter sp.]
MLAVDSYEDKVVHKLLRILVADDSSTVRDVVRRGINGLRDKAYFELEIVSDGEKALNVLRDSRVDLAFIDINMPGLSGPELVAAMRETQSDQCLTIAMSTGLDGTSETVFRENHAYHFMQKPFGSADISDIFETFLVLTQKYSILIVDDSATMRRLARRVVEKSRFSFEVFEAGGVDEAIRTMIDVRPQIVLTDFHMPGNDGLQLAGAIRSVSDDIAIYMMSTNETSYLERSAAFIGVDGFLKKPFAPEDIDAVMHKYLKLDAPKFGKTRKMFSFLAR